MINTVDKENLIYLTSISYNIWLARNPYLFEDKDISEEVTISKAANSIVEFNQATLITHQIDTSSTANSMRSTCMHNNKSWK